MATLTPAKLEVPLVNQNVCLTASRSLYMGMRGIQGAEGDVMLRFAESMALTQQ